MTGEIFPAISAFETALNIARSLINISNTAARNAAVVELTEKIIAAQTTQLAAIKRIESLEKELLEKETWETEKSRYELKNLGVSAFVFMLQKDARGTEPPHWICAKCFKEEKIYIIRNRERDRIDVFACPNCGKCIEPLSGAFESTSGGLAELNPKILRWLDG